MNELRKTFRPEFINRIDEIIIFNSLNKDVVSSILNKIIKDIEIRLQDKNLKIEITDAAKKYIIEKSYDENFGARPIKRYVTAHVENLIATAIIEDKIKYGDTILITMKNDEIAIENKKESR